MEPGDACCLFASDAIKPKFRTPVAVSDRDNPDGLTRE